MLKRSCAIVVPLLVVLASWGCAEDGALLGQADGVILPTLASIQENVFTPVCGACHFPGGASPMPLDSEDNAYNYLVGPQAPQPFAFFCGVPRVDAGNPDGSCIVWKIEDSPLISGDPMPRPPLPPLSQEEIDAIRGWILDGASR